MLLPPLVRRFVPPAALLLVAVACTDGMRFQLINQEQPGGDVGLPPANDQDFRPCWTGHMWGLDTNGDGRPDVVKVKDDSGRDVCHGTDSNHDGKIDQWDTMDERGKVAKRSRDFNGDGKPDQKWSFDPTAEQCGKLELDHNGDGTMDDALDLCPHGGAGAAATVPAPAADAGADAP
jgi:hypothetical protein